MYNKGMRLGASFCYRWLSISNLFLSCVDDVFAGDI